MAARTCLALPAHRSLVVEVTTSFDKKIAVALDRRCRRFHEVASEGSWADHVVEKAENFAVVENLAGPLVAAAEENQVAGVEIQTAGVEIRCSAHNQASVDFDS